MKAYLIRPKYCNVDLQTVADECNRSLMTSGGMYSRDAAEREISECHPMFACDLYVDEANINDDSHALDAFGRTPEQLVEEALTEAPGHPLVVHIHGWDRWALNGHGGRAVSLRVRGQSVDRAWTLCRTTPDAESFATRCQMLIDGGHE